MKGRKNNVRIKCMTKDAIVMTTNEACLTGTYIFIDVRFLFALQITLMIIYRTFILVSLCFFFLLNLINYCIITNFKIVKNSYLCLIRFKFVIKVIKLILTGKYQFEFAGTFVHCYICQHY